MIPRIMTEKNENMNGKATQRKMVIIFCTY